MKLLVALLSLLGKKIFWRRWKNCFVIENSILHYGYLGYMQKNWSIHSLLLLCNSTLLQLYTHGEKFNQPIFLCNNISGLVEPVSTLRSILYGLPCFCWGASLYCFLTYIVISNLTDPRWSQMISTGHCTQLIHLRFCSRKAAAGHLYLYSSTWFHQWGSIVNNMVRQWRITWILCKHHKLQLRK